MRHGLATLALAGTTPLTLPAAAQEQVSVGLCVSWPGYAMLEMAERQDLAPGYEIETTIFEDPLAGHAALAAGQIDVYECTGDYTPLAVERGTGVVNVAFTNPSYGVDHIVLAAAASEDEMKGARIGAPQAYIGQLLMGVWLDSVGVGMDEVEWVNLLADEAVGPMVSGDLDAAYLYEPWITRVTENLEGSRSVVNTADPLMLETGIFMDVVYMNGDFVAERREAAKAMLKARFDALAWWHENTEEANEALSDYLQWPVADIASVIGTNGKYREGGIYMYDFDEAARVCGVLEGEPPFGLPNGAMPQVVSTVNDWWVRLGLMEERHDPAPGIDCSLMADLVEEGYRQNLEARE